MSDQNHLPPFPRVRRGRPQQRFPRYARASYKQRVFLGRVLKALSSRRNSLYLARRIEECGTPQPINAAGGTAIYRCRSLFCPDCRRHRIGHRVARLLPSFVAMPRGDVYFVTVLLSVHSNLVTPSVHGGPLSKVTLDRIRRELLRLDECLAAAGLDELRLAGFVEIEAKPAAGQAGPVRGFIDAFMRDRWMRWADLPRPDDVLVSHIHLLVSATRDGSRLTQREISALFTRGFPHPRQVLVQPLRRTQEPAAAIAKCISYMMKGFVKDMSDARIVELARFLDGAGMGFFRFDRRSTRRAAPGGLAIPFALESAIEKMRERLRILEELEAWRDESVQDSVDAGDK